MRQHSAEVKWWLGDHNDSFPTGDTVESERGAVKNYAGTAAGVDLHYVGQTVPRVAAARCRQNFMPPGWPSAQREGASHHPASYFLSTFTPLESLLDPWALAS